MSEHSEVTLRPVTEADLDYFDIGATPESDPWNFFGFRAPGRVRREFALHGLLSADGGTFVVAVDEGFVGDVSFRATQYGPPPGSTAYNIGISLLAEHRGRGYGSAAQRQLADYLFATYPINRVEANTDVDNVAEQRALEKAGFRAEGVIRGAQWRAGAWHDLVAYARLRGD